MPRLRAAVIGAGNMGRHHVRVLDAFPDVDLVVVVDPAVASGSAVLPANGATVCGSIDDMPDVDFAVVATPTDSHLALAGALMERGVHVLVEKPLALTPADAATLVELAERRRLVLSVGHIERFNPAVSLVSRVVGSPLLMSFERLSPFTPRIGDSVVMDLMVHDLDLACWFAGTEPERIEAVGLNAISDTLDVCTACLRFPGGAVANIQASRITQDKVRRIAVSEQDRFILADSVRQDVSIKREVVVDFEDGVELSAYRQASVVEIPYLDRSGEPLVRELRDFIEAVQGLHPPLVDGSAGWRAVRLARQVERCATGAC